MFVHQNSAIATLTDMVADYKRRNIYVAFVKLREPLLDLFHKSGVMDLLGKNCVFNKVRDAIAALNDTRVFDEVRRPLQLLSSSSLLEGKLL
jgi:hypothetical protein